MILFPESLETSRLLPPKKAAYGGGFRRFPGAACAVSFFLLVCPAHLQSPVVEAEPRGEGRTEPNGRSAARRDLGNRAQWAGLVTSRPAAPRVRPPGLARVPGGWRKFALHADVRPTPPSLPTVGAGRGSLFSSPTRFCAAGRLRDEWGRRLTEADANRKLFHGGRAAFPGEFKSGSVSSPEEAALNGKLPPWSGLPRGTWRLLIVWKEEFVHWWDDSVVHLAKIFISANRDRKSTYLQSYVNQLPKMYVVLILQCGSLIITSIPPFVYKALTQTTPMGWLQINFHIIVSNH